MDISTRAGRTLKDISTAMDAVVEMTWPEHAPVDRIGLEIEAFPIVVEDRKPRSRLALHGRRGVVSTVEAASSPIGSIGPRSTLSLEYPTRSGGRITFEPGGQIEHSTAPHQGTAALKGEIDGVWDDLTARFHSESVCLVPIGIDLWHDVTQVPQQQTASRYQAMDRYFASAWPAGAVMMRSTCSIQVNLEGGVGRTREERWLAANLISPLLTAMFATSPGIGGVKSARAVTWQRIDPSRTGFPAWGRVTDADPIRDVSTRAMNANVMFVGRGGSAEAVDPGWSFGDWVANGHPDLGSPTTQDLETHLSTLFAEVRPRRGVLELRGIDSLPKRWWIVPAVFTAALLYDDDALGSTIEILFQLGADLRRAWEQAALEGLSDPQLRGAAEKLGRLALEAARRTDRFDSQAVSTADQFVERFTMRGLSPSDELRVAAAEPSSALAWACPDCSSGVLP